MRDIRFAARYLRRSPGFSIAVALTLALGIGLTTAVFSVVSAVLLKPLPYPAAERLVWMGESTGRVSGISVTWVNYQRWRDSNRSFEDMAAFQGTDLTLTERGEAPVVVLNRRFWSARLGGALAGVGIYGLLSYCVAVRESEIAIRLALGARPATFVRWTGLHALRLAALGLAVGAAGAWARRGGCTPVSRCLSWTRATSGPGTTRSSVPRTSCRPPGRP